MLNKIKAFFEFSAKVGIYFPSAYDRASDGPSVSLLFSHIANLVAIVSIIYLVVKDTMAGTIAAMIYATLMITFYLLRRLSKASFDLDDKSISLTGEEEKK